MPTAASRARSAGVWMPLSPTITLPAGTRGASRSLTDSEVLNTLRSRLLMPISRDFSFSARSSSSSLCTSTSTSMPNDSAASSISCAAASSSDAMMIRMQSAPIARDSATW